MSDNAPVPLHQVPAAIGDGRLDSWKEIAAYVRRDVTTVRRWEKREGLPVHRHLHDQRESVYAFKREIDVWWQGRLNQPGGKNHAIPLGRKREWIAWSMAAAGFVTALISVAALLRSPAAPQSSELRFLVAPPGDSGFDSASISPDGRQIAFTASAGGKRMLWVRPLRSLTPQTLPGTEEAALPFWSPDGRSVGFFAQGSLKTIDVQGGVPRIVSAAPDGRGGTWNRDGTIVFSPHRESGLMRVSDSGGPTLPVTSVHRPDERGHVWPQFLPDGSHFVYLADSDRPEHHHLFVGALDASRPRRLTPLLSNATYSDGHMLFARAGQLVAQPFDTRRLELTGEPITIAERVLQPWSLDHKTEFSVSEAGTLTYRTATADTQLFWRDRTGQRTPLAQAPAMYCEPTLSPDQKSVALDLFDPHPAPRTGFGSARITSDLWIMDVLGSLSQFTFDAAAEFDPVWSPDGTQIAFSSNRRGALNLFVRSATGADRDEPLYESNDDKHAQAWSPDGRFLIYGTYTRQTRADVWLLPLTGERTPRPLLQSEFSEEQAQISPDGRWISYTSNESGRSEVYVRDFPALTGKWRISTSGGGDARWRSDGRELFYIDDERRLVAVDVKPGTVLEAGTGTPLFDTGLRADWGTCRNHYDVSRDGARFLFTTPVHDDRVTPLTLVVNWRAVLHREMN